MTYPLNCPNCSADLVHEDGAGITTDELTPGTCYGFISDDGEDLELGGDTKLAWDCQETTDVKCGACGQRLPDLPDDLVYRFTPTFEEDVANSYAALLKYVAGELGAPSFAADMAVKGASSLPLMAGRWIDSDLEPRDFADVLNEIAGAYS